MNAELNAGDDRVVIISRHKERLEPILRDYSKKYKIELSEAVGVDHWAREHTIELLGTLLADVQMLAAELNMQNLVFQRAAHINNERYEYRPDNMPIPPGRQLPPQEAKPMFLLIVGPDATKAEASLRKRSPKDIQLIQIGLKAAGDGWKLHLFNSIKALRAYAREQKIQITYTN